MCSFRTRTPWTAFGLILMVSACVPSHQYQPLTTTALDIGQNRTIAVHSSADWRNTAVQVRKGEVYRVATRGTWNPGGFCGDVTPAGLKHEHLACMKGIFANSFPLPSANIGALVGRIGVNGQPFVIGGTEGFIADNDGPLFLVINDPLDLMFDNVGQIEVAVQRYAGEGSAVTFTTPAGGPADRTHLGNLSAVEQRTEDRAVSRVSGSPANNEKTCAEQAIPQTTIDACTALIQSGGSDNQATAVSFYRRGNAYRKMGRYQDALADYREVRRRLPDNPHIYNDMAWMLATAPDTSVRDGNEAVRLAHRAVSLRDSHVFRDTLAAAYAEAGHFPTAIEEENRALRMAGESMQKYPNDRKYFLKRIARYENRIELYRQGRPYREN